MEYLASDFDLRESYWDLSLASVIAGSVELTKWIGVEGWKKDRLTLSNSHRRTLTFSKLT